MFLFGSLIIRNQSTFKSALSLENIYPGSNYLSRLNKGEFSRCKEGFDGFIPLKELEITYSRSSGPGGQNVNRSDTKVTIKCCLKSASWIHSSLKTDLLRVLDSQLSKDGALIVRSDRTRSQLLNQADALQKLRTVIWESLDIAQGKNIPETPPEIEEKIRKGKIKSAQARLKEKRNRSDVKSSRKPPSLD